jgi:hypothetical protein
VREILRFEGRPAIASGNARFRLAEPIEFEAALEPSAKLNFYGMFDDAATVRALAHGPRHSGFAALRISRVVSANSRPDNAADNKTVVGQ